MFFSCINTCQVSKKLSKHETARQSNQISPAGGRNKNGTNETEQSGMCLCCFHKIEVYIFGCLCSCNLRLSVILFININVIEVCYMI